MALVWRVNRFSCVQYCSRHYLNNTVIMPYIFVNAMLYYAGSWRFQDSGQDSSRTNWIDTVKKDQQRLRLSCWEAQVAALDIQEGRWIAAKRTHGCGLNKVHGQRSCLVPAPLSATTSNHTWMLIQLTASHYTEVPSNEAENPPQLLLTISKQQTKILSRIITMQC